MDIGTAPADLVEMLARRTQPPRSPYLDQAQQYAAHLGQIQLWADLVWRQGFHAGMSLGLAAKPTRIVVSTEAFEALAAKLG